MSFIRNIILNIYNCFLILIYIFNFAISISLLLCGFYFDSNAHFVIGIILFLLPYISRMYFLINDKYYVRAISSSELESFLEHNIITYTDKPFSFEGEKIDLKAALSKAANYRVKNTYKKKALIWFHLSNEKNSFEPKIGGFIDTHYLQVKRKYKVTVKMKDLIKIDNVILFCPVNSFIVVVGDLKVKASYEEEFNWYDDKLYLKYVFRNIFLNILFIIPNEIKRTLGHFMDKKKN